MNSKSMTRIAAVGATVIGLTGLTLAPANAGNTEVLSVRAPSYLTCSWMLHGAMWKAEHSQNVQADVYKKCTRNSYNGQWSGMYRLLHF